MPPRPEMTTRERFHAVMNFQPFDRLPIIEWATWWDQTIARWHTEGLPPTITDRYDINRHFGVELYLQDWIGPWIPPAPHHGAPVITTEDEYERLRPNLYPAPARILNADRLRQWAALQRSGDAVVWITLLGFFWYPRTLLGIEPHLFAFYDQPELMHRMNEDLLNWNRQILESIYSICTPDFMTFAEDLSYNHGPMLSEKQFDEFLTPYYQRIVPFIHQHGTISIIDSDGDVTVPANWFERAGLQGILPLERQAGVDIAALRAAHPHMRFIGHFDKLTMTAGEAAMRKEFQRLLPTASRGGFLISVDHQTPPGVSYQAYQTFLRLFREFAPQVGKF
jgi:hypothetical protein